MAVTLFMASQNYLRLRMEPDILENQNGIEIDADQWFFISFTSCYLLYLSEYEILNIFVTFIIFDALVE